MHLPAGGDLPYVIGFGFHTCCGLLLDWLSLQGELPLERETEGRSTLASVRRPGTCPQAHLKGCGIIQRTSLHLTGR